MNLRTIKIGEGLLWVGFAFFAGCVAYGIVSETYLDNAEAAPLMTGLFALAAVGVRATRSIPAEASHDNL